MFGKEENLLSKCGLEVVVVYKVYRECVCSYYEQEPVEPVLSEVPH